MPDMPVFHYNILFLKHCSLETTLYCIRIIQYSLGDYILHCSHTLRQPFCGGNAIFCEGTGISGRPQNSDVLISTINKRGSEAGEISVVGENIYIYHCTFIDPNNFKK
jgi:hypothetical protein